MIMQFSDGTGTSARVLCSCTCIEVATIDGVHVPVHDLVSNFDSLVVIYSFLY